MKIHRNYNYKTQKQIHKTVNNNTSQIQNTNTQIANGLGAKITEMVKPPYLLTSHTAYIWDCNSEKIHKNFNIKMRLWLCNRQAGPKPFPYWPAPGKFIQHKHFRFCSEWYFAKKSYTSQVETGLCFNALDVRFVHCRGSLSSSSGFCVSEQLRFQAKHKMELKQLAPKHRQLEGVAFWPDFSVRLSEH